jgi:hypothetical protein
MEWESYLFVCFLAVVVVVIAFLNWVALIIILIILLILHVILRWLLIRIDGLLRRRLLKGVLNRGGVVGVSGRVVLSLLIRDILLLARSIVVVVSLHL